MRIIITTLSILFALCVLAVAISNHAPVTIKLWPDAPEYTYNTSVFWVILFGVGAGIAFTGIVAVIEGSKIRLSNARLRAQIRRLQQEVETLRRPSLGLDIAAATAHLPAHGTVETVEIDEDAG